MRKNFLGCFFSFFLLFAISATALFAEENPGAASSVPASVPEKLFYKISLNESFFIQEREAVVNARATVEVLQGELDKVSLEVFGLGNGQGEIFSVSGEKVKDWSIRRAGTRTFLEIRPKELGGEKSFTLTISGRQPLKLPTTISPLLFSGVDSTAFFGVVQFLATADLRLYAKQERGLIPLGERSRSEINYAIQGAPSLRLDIARANELLAPVSLENFSLVGEVEKSGARFRMRAKARVREIGAEVSVLTGCAALLDFPEKNEFVVLAKTDEKTGLSEYSLRFPARGEFDVDLRFDAGITDADGWRRMNFSVPVAQVAPYSLKGMPADTVFAADNVSIPQLDESGSFSGFLPSSGTLVLRWRPSIPTPPEFSAGVYSLDTVSEMQITTGVLKQKSELNFTISQGELSSVFLKTAGTGEILSVEGQDLLSWNRVKSADGNADGLFVRLSRPKAQNYTLRIVSQTRTGEFPETLSPLRFVPERTGTANAPLSAVCVRDSEFLRLRNGIGIRCEALPQPGMTQVLASAFPRESDFFEKDVPADETSVYRISSETEKLRVRADFIRSALAVFPRVRWNFDGEKAHSRQLFEFEVADAPLYEMKILVPAELEITALDSDIVASAEISEDSGREGYRLLHLVFSAPVTGKNSVAMNCQLAGAKVGEDTRLRACLFPQAHFVSGKIGIASLSKNLRLLPKNFENLSEVAPDEYAARAKPDPQLAFLIREGEWALTVRPEVRAIALAGESSCVYKIDREKIFGNFAVTYSTGGVPVPFVRMAFPPAAKVLSVSGENVRDWRVREDGVAVVALNPSNGERFSVSASFELPRENGEKQNFDGVRLLDVVSDAGTILLTADGVLTLASEESVRSLAALPLSDAVSDYTQRGGAILFRAYQFAERPFTLNVESSFLDEKKTADLVVTEARIAASNAGQSCDIVYRFRSFGATELRLGVPAGTKVIFEGAKPQADGTVILPLPKDASEISLRTERVPVPGAGTSDDERILLPRVFAPVVRTVFTSFGDASSETMRVEVAGRRLNASLDASLAHRFFEHFMEGRWVFVASFLCLVCALIGANFAKKRSRYRLCLSVSLIAGTVLSLSCVWWLVGTVRPQYGEAVLCAGLTEPGAQLDVVLRGFYFLGGDEPTLSALAWCVVAVFCAGVFLLLYGTVFRRRQMRLRVIGRVALYAAAGVFALEDFPYRVPAFVAAAIATEVSAFISFSLIRIVAKIMDTRPGIPLGGTGAALVAAALLVPAQVSPQLRAETASAGVLEIHTLAAEAEAQHDVADRITQAIDVREDRIVARGDIRVTGYAGDRFDLLASPAVLTSFEKADDSMLRLERRRAENSGHVYQVVLERAGTFSAKFSYELALSEQARGFPILSGAAAADVAIVNLPRSEVQISAEGAVTCRLSAYGEKAQLAQIVFKPKATRAVHWNPRERDRSRETLSMFATGDNLYVPAAGVIEGRHVMRFVPAQGTVSRVRIRIPQPFSVSRVEGAAIHRWNFDRETGVLTVLFTAPRTTDFSLAVVTQAQLSLLPEKRKFAALEALDCDEQVRTIGIATDETIQVDAVYAGKLVSIDEEEFLASLEAAGMKTDTHARLRRAFRTVGAEGEFEAEISAVQPNLRIDTEEKFFVNGDSVRAEIDVSAHVSRAELFSLPFRVPAGINVERINGDALAYWTKTPCEDGSTLVTMRLKNALADAQKFSVVLAGAFPQLAKEWTFPEISFPGAKIQRGNVSVSVEEGLRLRPDSSGAATFRDAASDGRGSTFAFSFFSRGEPPKFSVLESKPFTNVSWLHRISPRGRYAESSVQMIFDIENVARSSVRVRLPEEALAVRFSGEDVVSFVPADPAEPGLWNVNFSKPLRGNVAVAAEFFTALPIAANVQAVSVSVADADRQTAWLAVEHGDVFSALKSNSPEKVSAADVPENLRGALSGREWFVEKYAEKYPAEISISAGTLAEWRACSSDAHGDSFIGESVSRHTVFSRDKALTEERVVLKALRSDVLRIALPEGGSLKAVFVNGNAAKIVLAPEIDARAVWLPIFSRGSESVVVSVLYEAPLKNSLRGERRVREILPAEIIFAEKISWSLRSVGEEKAEILDVFGREPARVREAPDADADCLDAYFRGNAESASNAADDGWETFVVAGKDCLQPRAVLAFPRGVPADNADADTEIFLLAFAALVVLKLIRFLRFRKNLRK